MAAAKDEAAKNAPEEVVKDENTPSPEEEEVQGEEAAENTPNEEEGGEPEPEVESEEALKQAEEEAAKERAYAGGEAHKVAYQGVEYDLRNPDDIRAYREAKMETQKPGFKYDVESVYAKHGGAMYEHGIEHPAERGDYTGEVAGAGTGTSDSVPAWLSDGEFVLTAKAVKGAGGGDRDIGAARMYDMMAELEATA